MSTNPPKVKASSAPRGRVRQDEVFAKLPDCHRMLLSCALWLWLADRLANAWERIGCAQQFQIDWGAGFHQIAIAAAIGALIGFGRLRDRCEQRRFRSEADWMKLLKTKRLFHRSSIAYLIISSAVMLFVASGFATCGFDHAAKALACLMSDVGQYELAELAYRSALDLNGNKVSGRYSSMAAWHSSYTRENPDTLRKKNDAVATVYGSHSRQLAGRYFYLGLMFGVGPENNVSEAIYWHTKALAMYEQDQAITKCVDAIAQIALLQEESNKPESKRLIAKAIRLMPAMDEEPYACTPNIEYMARRNGNVEQAAIFRRGFKEPRTNADDNATCRLCLISLIAIFGSGLGCSLAKELALADLTRTANGACSVSTDQQTLMASLNRIINLNVMAHNLQAGEQNSLSLLAIAEGRQLAASSVPYSGGNVIQSCIISASKHEVFRALFALALAYSFYL